MNLQTSSRLVLLLGLLLTPGCSDESAPATDTDAGTAQDTGSGGGGGDAGACEDFTGAYTITGTCSVPGFSPYRTACIVQTGCNANVTVETGPLTGTVMGNRLTFSSSVSGIPLICAVTRAGDGSLMVDCEAAGGAATCTATGARVTLPGATSFCCDVSAQTACGAGNRCSPTSEGGRNVTLVTACVPAGTAAAGETCTRVDGRLGNDNCGAGLACVNYGQATSTERTCQRLCRSNADCPDGQGCIGIADAPRAGVCRPRCTILGNDCPAGTCRYLNAWGATDAATAPAIATPTCQPSGAGAEGDPCNGGFECGAGLNCSRPTATDSFACRRICDSTNACPAGFTCNGTASPTNPNASGSCFPAS